MVSILHHSGVRPGRPLNRPNIVPQRIFQRMTITASTPFPALAAGDAAARLLSLDDAGFRDAVAADTTLAVAVLASLRDDPVSPLGARTRALLPTLAALATAADRSAAIEHEPAPAGDVASPLLDHVLRVLGRKLRGLETGRLDVFQQGDGLGRAAFEEEVAGWRALEASAIGSVVRLALMHLDIAKGGDAATRTAWERSLGADLSVHNTAGAQILSWLNTRDVPDGSALAATTVLREQPVLRHLLLALVDAHGLAGQVIRGEMPWRVLAPFARTARELAGPLGRSLGIAESEARAMVVRAMHVVNLCDTAGVREGLLRDALHDAFVAVREQLLGTVASDAGDTRLADALAEAERAAWRGAGRTAYERTLARVADRLGRLRAGRAARGESREAVREVLAPLADAELERFAALVDRCQFWYAESGTSALSPDAQVKLLALGLVHAAAATDQRDKDAMFHLTCLPLVPALGAPDDPSVPYRVRLVETLLAPLSLGGILDGEVVEGAESPLGSVSAIIGGAQAIGLTFRESAETTALLTLLPIYERKSSAAFHAMLKLLCDVYGLRKDEFDRVANEELYLAHMNSARNDKQRMLDWVRPGRIVEVGPGGGVVLDLCEARFPGSDILGIDASRMVAEALRRRKADERHRWEVRHADAFNLPDLVGAGSVDCVIFCSLLHEIYSYVEHPGDDGVPRRFRLESVRDLLRAAWRALGPGGRIVIRDGVMPAPGVRQLDLLAPDAEEFLALFTRQFEGRPIVVERTGPHRVRLSTADAMEFAYTYIWGAASFPFEVREQYGVLTYEAYRDHVVQWLSADGPAPIVVPIPSAEAEYVQGGYRRGLADKLRFLDEHGEPCDLPASNALWVYEKTRA
jgi:SAM-dependent methyltransferase